MNIEELYVERCLTPHNIDQHLPTLKRYAMECGHITEFGTDIGFSTCAFLAAKPQVLHCYDIIRQPLLSRVTDLCPRETGIRFHLMSTTDPYLVIDETDLLFIDTIHSYDQVRWELAMHGNRSRKYIILHDTVSFPEIVPAILNWLELNPHWSVKEWSLAQSGLAVLERKSE